MSLTVEGALDRSRLAEVASSVFRRIGAIVVPVVLVLLLVPGLVLSVYGPAYAAHSSDLLRLLALGVLAKTVTTLYFSLARVERRVSRIALGAGRPVGATMGLSWVLMGTMRARTASAWPTCHPGRRWRRRLCHHSCACPAGAVRRPSRPESRRRTRIPRSGFLGFWIACTMGAPIPVNHLDTTQIRHW